MLNKPAERLNEQAAHSVTQMPESRLGDNFAARIESQTVEQTTRIETVAAQLKSWREELLQSEKPSISHHV